MVRRIAHTLGQANDMFHTRFGEAVDILKKYLAKHPWQGDRECARSGEEQLSEWRPHDPSDVGKQHEGVARLEDDFEAALPTAEGVLWTNKFQS